MALEVERLVGKPLDELKAASLVVEGTVHAEGAGYQAELTLDDGHGERRRVLEGATCHEVCGAAALTVAIALDPTLMMRPPAAPPAGCPPTVVCDPTPCAALPAPAPCPQVRFVAPRHKPEPTTRATAVVGFGATAIIGVLPRTAPGALIVTAIELDDWRAEVSGGTAASATNAAPSGSGRGASFQLWRLGLHACWFPGVFGVGPCLGGEVGRVIGRGYGVADPAKDELTWLASSLGILGRLRVGPSAELGLRADALAALHRPVFQLSGSEVHRPSFLSVELGAHAAARF